MKAWRWAFPLGVFSFVGLGFWFGRPEPIATEDFSFDSPTPTALPPLVADRPDLELLGLVLDVDGNPLEDVLVALWPEEAGSARPLAWDYTSGSGTFRLQHLEPGPQRALLSAPGRPPEGRSLTLPLGEAVEWRLEAAPEPLPELPPIRWTGLEGRVERVAGALSTVQGLEIVIRPAPEVPELSGASLRRTTTDLEGRFAFERMVAVDHVLEVLPGWARGGSWPVLGRFHIAGDRPPGPLVIELPVGSLEGRLLETSGRPLEGALVTLTRLEASDALGAPQIWPPEVTNFRGSFRFEMLPPGRYRLKLRAGAAAREIEVSVSERRHEVLELEPMDPRAWR